MAICSISKEGNSNRILYWRLFDETISISKLTKNKIVVYIFVQKNIFSLEVIVEIIDQMSLTSAQDIKKGYQHLSIP
jgi:hypothetical protein